MLKVSSCDLAQASFRWRNMYQNFIGGYRLVKHSNNSDCRSY